MKMNSFEDLGQIHGQFKESEIPTEINQKKKLEDLSSGLSSKISLTSKEIEAPLLDNELLENVIENFLIAYFDFNETTDIEKKEDIIKDLCFYYEDLFRFSKNETQKIFLAIETDNDIDISLFNFIFSLTKVAGAYNLPGIYRAVEKYFRSIGSNQQEKNYLMSFLPKHFLEIMEGVKEEEYAHSLYSRLDSETFITRKENGVIYMSKPEEINTIIKNWDKINKLEKIETSNKKDKDVLDNIEAKMKNIKKELSYIYSSEYSSDGKFIGIKYSVENELIAHTNSLKKSMEKLDQIGSQIINKNNPDLDLRFAKADELHKEIDSMFQEEFSFEIFEKKLIGLNLDASKLFKNYVTFWSEPNIRKFLEDEFGFYFINHTFEQQVYFLDYLNQITVKQGKEIKSFSKKYGVDGFNTFLSISYGGKEMVDKILLLGKSEIIPEEMVRLIFRKYGEITDTVYKVEEYLNEISADQDNINDPKIIKEIKEKLLMRGKELLSSFSENKEEVTLESLDNIKNDNELFCALLKSLKENKVKVNLLKFKDIYLEINSPQWLDASFGYENQKQQTEMLTMIYQNYKETPILARKLADELTDIFDGKGKHRTTIEMLKNKGEIIAFCRFEEVGDNKLYFGSFNVKEGMRGLNIGDSFLEATLNRKAENNEIMAVSHSANRIGAHYIENGFIANKFTPDYSGIPIFSIVRNDSKNNIFLKTKSLSIEKIKEIKNSNDIEVYHEKNQEELISKLEKINKGYVLTRYFNDPQTKDWYIVLEKMDFSHLE